MMNQSSKKNEEIFKISEEKIVKNVKKIEEFQKEINFWWSLFKKLF